ncbi:uncharacterized protein TNCV_1574631 [Trichonephila clavipes]|nr:uncharacterized protein TNCV_1574631 [Trichonephila clavipes]
MDTDPPLTDADICAKMRELRQDVLLQSGSVRYLEYNLNLATTGEVLQPKEQIDKLAANLQEMKELLEHKKAISTLYNEIATIPSDLASKSSEKKPLEKSKIKEKPKSIDKNLKNDKNKITEKAKTTKQTEDPNKLKKARPDGFSSPTKHEISRKYPKSKSKLSGEFLKIFAASTDDHRAITTLLTEKGEQYFALNPVLNRPQKIVIKGLPINIDIEEIRQDLTSRGFKVIKVAQFNKSKSKMKLPIFMVEIEKSPDSPDIFQLETCCYLTIKVDTYNRRPGAVL